MKVTAIKDAGYPNYILASMLETDDDKAKDSRGNLIIVKGAVYDLIVPDDFDVEVLGSLFTVKGKKTVAEPA